MHQNQWLAAIAELEADGLEATPVPHAFPRSLELGDVAYQYLNCSDGTERAKGRWASSPSLDGRGEIEYVESPRLMGEDQALNAVDPRTYGTPPVPRPPPVDPDAAPKVRGAGA